MSAFPHKSGRFAAVASLALAVSMAMAPQVYSCSTIVVGKAVSATGNYIIGHNEDNDNRIITSQYWVPAADHPQGEMIEYEPDAAKIPQVPHTYGFYWSQTLHPDGYSYSDGFVNENGVVIASNQSYGTTEDAEKLHEGGVGYGIRRLVAERAKNARDGVDIAIKLVETYGYRASGRVYTIADSQEVWQLNLLKGGRYLAKKLADDEVTYVSNAYSLGIVDIKAPDVIASPDLIQHAIETGRYTPAKAGDYSDFNFRKAYQKAERRAMPWIKDRAQRGWEIITGKEIKDQEQFPYSFKPERKFTIDDVKAVLSSHSKYEKRTTVFHERMSDIDNGGTFESAIYDINPDKMLITGYRTSGRACENPYVPFFPLAKPSLQQSFMTPEEATKQQFHGKPVSFSHRTDVSLFTYLDSQNFTEYLGTQKKLRAEIDKLEDGWDKDLANVKQTARFLAGKYSTQKAYEYLHQYNIRTYDEATAAIKAYLDSLPKADVKINATELSKSKSKDVQVTVFGTKTLDVTKVDPKSVEMGLPYENSDIDYIPGTPATKLSFEDVNKDGVQDMIVHFDGTSMLELATVGYEQDLWLRAKVKGQRIAGFDTVKLVK